MNTPLYIARRYFTSGKQDRSGSTNAVQVISRVSMMGVAVGTMALIIVLSAFNGLQHLVESMYSKFDPDIKITAVRGKTFSVAALPETQIRKIEGVLHYTQALEETVYIRHNKREVVARLKGVSDEFRLMTGIDSNLVEGNYLLESNDGIFCVIGYGVAYDLDLFITPDASPLKVYAAKKDGNYNPTSPDDAFQTGLIMPGGIFSINQDFDMKYILAPLSFSRSLLNDSIGVTSIEIGLDGTADADEVKSKLEPLLGKEYKVQTRAELNEIVFKTNETEKWVTYMILTFILIIATFNVIGSLTMLILDKKKDISILRSMGASDRFIRQIFILEGLLITGSGGLLGLVLGAGVCLAQQHFGLLRLDAIIVEYYPIRMMFSDFVIVFATVMVIGFAATIIPSGIALRRSVS